MKLTLRNSGREIEVVAPPSGSTSRAGLWVGETDAGIPVLALISVLSPLIPADDSRQREFERDRENILDVSELHPEIAEFPSKVLL